MNKNFILVLGILGLWIALGLGSKVSVTEKAKERVKKIPKSESHDSGTGLSEKEHEVSHEYAGQQKYRIGYRGYTN